MNSAEHAFLKLGRYVVGVGLIWMALVGLLDIGFTTVAELPLIEIDSVAKVVYALQLIIGIGVFNNTVKRIAKPVAMLYFLFILYNIYTGFSGLFEPAIPYFSDMGRNVVLELLLIFASFCYLKNK